MSAERKGRQDVSVDSSAASVRDLLDDLDPEIQESVRQVVRRLEARIIVLTGERDALLARLSEADHVSDAASLRQEAADWLEFFRESANPQTAAERWVYLDEAAVLVERLLAEEAESK